MTKGFKKDNGTLINFDYVVYMWPRKDGCVWVQFSFADGDGVVGLVIDDKDEATAILAAFGDYLGGGE